MTGSRVVTVNPMPSIFNVTGGTVCSGSSVTVGLSRIYRSGVRYQLKLNGTNLGAVKNGTGSALSWGAQASIGTYTITATIVATSCTQLMNGSPIIYPEPIAYTVSGGGAICDGTSSAISLSNSQVGVSYQLKLNGTNLGSTLAGTGSSLNWANLTSPGTYTITATNANCSPVTMTGNAVMDHFGNS